MQVLTKVHKCVSFFLSVLERTLLSSSVFCPGLSSLIPWELQDRPKAWHRNQDRALMFLLAVGNTHVIEEQKQPGSDRMHSLPLSMWAHVIISLTSTSIFSNNLKPDKSTSRQKHMFKLNVCAAERIQREPVLSEKSVTSHVHTALWSAPGAICGSTYGGFVCAKVYLRVQ